MNTRSLLPRSLRLRAVFLASLGIIGGVASPAAPSVFVGDRDIKGPAGDFLDPMQWTSGELPRPGDDITASDTYFHDGPVGVLKFKSLVHERNARGFFVRTSLDIASDVLLYATLEFQRDNATLRVGESVVVENGDLSFVGGLASERNGQLSPRFTAKSLDVQATGRLRLRWFKNVPEGLPGNSVPYFRVLEDVVFAPGAGLRIQLESLEPGATIFPGEYLLLTAGAIKGPLPALEIINLPSDSKVKPELKLSPDRKRLLLVVTAVR